MWWRLVIDYPRMSFDNCRSQGVVAYPNSHEEDSEALRIFDKVLCKFLAFDQNKTKKINKQTHTHTQTNK